MQRGTPRRSNPETLLDSRAAEIANDRSELLTIPGLTPRERHLGPQNVHAGGGLTREIKNHSARAAVDRGSQRQSQTRSRIHKARAAVDCAGESLLVEQIGRAVAVRKFADIFGNVPIVEHSAFLQWRKSVFSLGNATYVAFSDLGAAASERAYLSRPAKTIPNDASELSGISTAAATGLMCPERLSAMATAL